MTFNEESLRKGIQFGLGSKGIWTPELEDEMFKEIKNQALSQVAVISRRELLLDFAEYSENDQTSTALDECVDNYIDSIKQ